MREFLVNRPDAAAMERILENHISDAVGVVLRLAWQAGLLRDEITNLTWEQVDFERSQIQLPSRTVPVDGTLMDCLHAAHRRCNSSPMQPMSKAQPAGMGVRGE